MGATRFKLKIMKVLFSVIAFSCIIGLGHSLKCYEFSDETKLGEGVECPSEANACLKAVAEMYHTRAYARSCENWKEVLKMGIVLSIITMNYGLEREKPKFATAQPICVMAQCQQPHHRI